MQSAGIVFNMLSIMQYIYIMLYYVYIYISSFSFLNPGCYTTKDNFAGDDEVGDFLPVLAIKWGVADDHEIEDDATTPYVALFVVLLVQEYLGRNVKVLLEGNRQPYRGVRSRFFR